MKKNILSILLVFISFISFAQNYAVGHRLLTWIDSSRSNRTVKFEVYYPANAKGDNVPVVNNGKKFPLVIFGHGYQLDFSAYLWLKDSLVPKGFFLVFPRTEEQLFPSHTDFGKDYAFIINRFDATKNNTAGWYYNRIKNNYAVGGHSMGGGSSLLSVQYSTKIKAVFNFAAAETNPSAIAACTGVDIPALLFSGGKDCITPPSSNQVPMYNNIQNVCKTYVQINAAKHCQWANNDGTCRAGELFCSPASPSPKATITTTFSLLLPWLNNKLNLNEQAGQRFQQLLTSTNGITYKKNCNTNNIIVDDNQKNTSNNVVKIYPSFAAPGTTVNIALPGLENNALLRVFNQSGKLIVAKNVISPNSENMKIATAGFEKGVYFIVVTDKNTSYKSSFVME